MASNKVWAREYWTLFGTFAVSSFGSLGSHIALTSQPRQVIDTQLLGNIFAKCVRHRDIPSDEYYAVHKKEPEDTESSNRYLRYSE